MVHKIEESLKFKLLSMQRGISDSVIPTEDTATQIQLNILLQVGSFLFLAPGTRNPYQNSFRYKIPKIPEVNFSHPLQFYYKI